MHGLFKDFSRAAHFGEVTSCNTPTIAQIAVATCLEKGYGGHMPKILGEYRAVRDALADVLENVLPRAVFRKSRAGIFIYADLGEYIGRGPARRRS